MSDAPRSSGRAPLDSAAHAVFTLQDGWRVTLCLTTGTWTPALRSPYLWALQAEVAQLPRRTEHTLSRAAYRAGATLTRIA